jgi:two-component system response regulator YesN
MKFLIADDEILVRITVQKALNDLGITGDNIFQAANGKEMIDLLNNNSISIAFVDIKMPDISGLDAIEQCIHTSPHTSFYILTGFGKFEYASQAIHIGVKDFLLKPLDIQTLVSILENEKYHFELESNNLRNSYIAKLSSALLRNSTTESNTDFFCLPCYCTYDNSKIPNLESLYQIEANHHNISAVIIPAQAYAYIGFCTSAYQNSAVVLSYIKKLLLQLLHLKENSHISLFYQNDFIPFSKINDGFHELKQYSSIRVTYGMKRLYLLDSKITQNIKKVEKLNTLFCQLQDSYSCYSYVDFMNTKKKILAEMETTNIYDNKITLENINTYILNSFIIPEHKLLSPGDFKNYLDRISHNLLERSNVQEFSMEQVLSYIDLHYAEDISINSLAAMFSISPNYFSSRFKKETSIKFTDYITNLRVARAKQLLTETNLQVKEISSQIGYFTTSHFIRTFVKYEGITPLEFRSTQKSIL